jgi:hypothetical protein
MMTRSAIRRDERPAEAVSGYDNAQIRLRRLNSHMKVPGFESAPTMLDRTGEKPFIPASSKFKGRWSKDQRPFLVTATIINLEHHSNSFLQGALENGWGRHKPSCGHPQTIQLDV